MGHTVQKMIVLLFSFCLLVSPAFSLEIKSQSSLKENLSVNTKLIEFINAVENLQSRNLVDGEILIAKGDQILFHVESQDILDDHPQFMIGSVSKQFFAVALLKLLYDSSPAENELDKLKNVEMLLHYPICYFLPRNATIWTGKMPEWAKIVSLHQLLSHTSGVPNFTDIKGFDTSPRFEKPHTKAEIIQLILQEPLLFPPGSQYSYSNTGYVLIAEILETITQTNVSDYMEQCFFKPLGLTSTYAPSSGRSDQLHLNSQYSRLVPQKLYDPSKDQEIVYMPNHYEDISLAIGAGSVITTTKDLLKWNLSLHKIQSVLPKPLYKLLISPNLENYGYGITITNHLCGMVIGHQGAIGTYRTALFYLPEQDISIIILSNIAYDWSKIEPEFKFLVEDLRSMIPNEKECNEVATQAIIKKYPGKRGFMRINDLITDLVK